MGRATSDLHLQVQRCGVLTILWLISKSHGMSQVEWRGRSWLCIRSERHSILDIVSRFGLFTWNVYSKRRYVCFHMFALDEWHVTYTLIESRARGPAVNDL